jgi:hypothetical protein
VYIGDGIKVGKEGRKMPGVKRLHQESGDVNKPEWIRGHYFSALGIMGRRPLKGREETTMHWVTELMSTNISIAPHQKR